MFLARSFFGRSVPLICYGFLGHASLPENAHVAVNHSLPASLPCRCHTKNSSGRLRSGGTQGQGQAPYPSLKKPKGTQVQETRSQNAERGQQAARGLFWCRSANPPKRLLFNHSRDCVLREFASLFDRSARAAFHNQLFVIGEKREFCTHAHRNFAIWCAEVRKHEKNNDSVSRQTRLFPGCGDSRSKFCTRPSVKLPPGRGLLPLSTRIPGAFTHAR